MKLTDLEQTKANKITSLESISLKQLAQISAAGGATIVLKPSSIISAFDNINTPFNGSDTVF